MIVVSLKDLSDEKTAAKKLSETLSHELGHMFCDQEFPAKVNKRAFSYESRAWKLQEKMMNLFSTIKKKRRK